MEKNRKLYIFVFLLLIVVKISLVRHQPLLAYTNAIYDDHHYIDQARSILGGDWLGPYNQFTLIKGPFLPLWIVFTFLLGIPFLLSLHLLYTFSCLILITALEPVLRRPIYSLLLFTALLYNPLTYDTYAATRVTRDALYTSLTFLVFACVMALFLRRNESFIIKLPWALGLGLAFSASALTREETIWLVPSLLFMFVLSWIGLNESGFKKRTLNMSIWSLLPLTYLILVGTVSFLNYRYYSLFSVTEMKAPEFVAAYSAIQRVIPERFIPMVPAPKEIRMQIYHVSSAFRELEAYFERPQSPWTGFKIDGIELPEGEILGGWFIWAFRDAVADAGYYSNGKFPAEYYHTLTNEINTACDIGKLKCVPKKASLAPVWNKAYMEPAINSFSKGIELLVTFGSLTSHPGESYVDGQDEALYKDLTQEEISKAPETIYEISGWALDTKHEVYAVITKNDQDFWKDTKIIHGLSSPDVFDYFLSQGKTVPSAKSARFTITTRCKICVLEIRRGNESLVKLKLDDSAIPTAWNDSSTFVSIDSKKSFLSGLVYRDKYNGIKVMILEWIGRLYQKVFPAFATIALIFYIVLTAQIKKSFNAWGVICLLGVASISRLGLLSIISSSSFPAMNNLYLSPAHPAFIGFTLFTLILAFDRIVHIIQPKAKLNI